MDPITVVRPLKPGEDNTDSEASHRQTWMLEGSGSQDYSPFEVAGLHRRFTSLTDQQIPEFASQFGLLGLGSLVNTEEFGTIKAESLSIWRKKIRELAVALELWDMARERREGLAGIVVWSSPYSVELKMKWIYDHAGGKCRVFPHGEKPSGRRKKGAFYGSTVRTIARSETDAALIAQWRKEKNVVDPAIHYVYGQINRHIAEDVYPQFVANRRGKTYDILLLPRNLLTAMWLMFSLEISGRSRPAVCCRCGRWFEQTYRRRSYCSNACKQSSYRERLGNRK